jgi:hypothetical protein
LLTIDSWGDTEEVIAPLCPPDVKEGGSKAGKSPGSKINSGRNQEPDPKGADNKYH